jgi:transcriptional regulator with XRE-family HTH domain
MSICLRIKELRELKKLSQKAVSVLIKIDNSQLSKIEQGKLQPTLAQLMDISSTFNVSMDWLCFGKVEETLVNSEENLKDKIIAGLEREVQLLREKVSANSNDKRHAG